MNSKSACAICGGTNLDVLYRGPIRIGRFGNFSREDHIVWKCTQCLAGFLPNTLGQSDQYYESQAYREEVDSGTDVADYFRLHDGEQAANLAVTGTSIFRDKIVADVGCGGGSFLDAVKGYARGAVAIEPSKIFRESLSQRGYASYPYAKDALLDHRGKVDVVTSFSVLEHVEKPLSFLKDMRDFLVPSGKVILSTPNADDALLEALPDGYPSFFFRKAHLWYFNPQSLKGLMERAGFRQIRIIPRQRFGLSNFLRWMKDRSPQGHKRFEFVSEVLDASWKAELERTFRCHYLYVEADLAE